LSPASISVTVAVVVSDKTKRSCAALRAARRRDGMAAMSERRRVLHLAPGGDLQGGAQRQLAYLAEGLARSRYEPLVLLPRDGDLRDALDRAGVQTQVVPYPLFSRGELLRLRHRLWTERRRAHARVIDVARAYAPQLVHGDYAVAPYLNAIAAALG